MTVDEMRAEVNANLPHLMAHQLSLFNRIHDNAPWGGWANCPDEEVKNSYDMVERFLNW